MKPLILSIIALCFFACGKKKTLQQPQPAPVNERCGCMDTTALNYDSKANKKDTALCKYKWQEWVGEWVGSQTISYLYTAFPKTPTVESCSLVLKKSPNSNLNNLLKISAKLNIDALDTDTVSFLKNDLCYRPWPGNRTFSAHLSNSADTLYFGWSTLTDNNGTRGAVPCLRVSGIMLKSK